jgi:histidinol-phosphate aminotransferase
MKVAEISIRSAASKHRGWCQAWPGIERDWLLLTGGIDAAIRGVFETYGAPGKHVALPDPTFAMYSIYARIFEMPIRALEYDEDLVLSKEAIIDALDDDVRLLALPNPNSPTGTIFSKEDLAEFLSAAASLDVLVLIDEAYYYFSRITAAGLIADFSNLVVARSFSKAAGLAGTRLGYTMAQEAVAENLRRVKPMYEISGLALRFGEFVVRNDHLILDYARTANEGREHLSDVLARLGCRVFESHTNFVVARPPSNTEIAGLGKALRQRGHLIKAGSADGPMRDCIRITTASVATLEPFVEALRELFPGYSGQG